MPKRSKILSVSGSMAALAALAGLAAPPAAAQFGGIDIGRVTRSATSTDSDGCPKGKKKSVGGAILGGLAGQVVGNQVSRTGVGTYVALPDFEDQLSKAIACKLDPEEQKLAAEATLTATRSNDEADGAPPEVGSSAAWTSNTREGVSGTSTVTSRQGPPGGAAAGADCLTVTDVIIVDGQETRAEKKMCRAPGSKRYAIVA